LLIKPGSQAALGASRRLGQRAATARRRRRAHRCQTSSGGPGVRAWARFRRRSGRRGPTGVRWRWRAADDVEYRRRGSSRNGSAARGGLRRTRLAADCTGRDSRGTAPHPRAIQYFGEISARSWARRDI